MSTRKSYSGEWKLEVVQYAEKYSKREAGRHYGVDEKCVRRWSSQQSILQGQLQKKNKNAKPKPLKRLSGAGRKRKLPELDDRVFEWILEQRSRSLRVSLRMIQDQARKIFTEHSTSGVFKASRGWLWKFMKRMKLSLRRKTTVCQKDPIQLYEIVANYLLYVSNIVDDSGAGEIIAMDETSLWFDMMANTTVDCIGAKAVPLKTTGHEKSHATIILAAKGDGTKFKPYVIFKKSIREVKKLQVTKGVIVRSTVNGWANDEIIKNWLDDVITRFSFRRRVLIWDSYKCHISESTKNHLQNFNIKCGVIPGGCTKYVQAPDVCWNKPFKAKLTECYDSWMSGSADKSYTKGGNMRAASKELMLKWVKIAWDSLSTSMIKDSFKHCGLTTSADGSEDELITCLKPGHACHPALEKLKLMREEANLEEAAKLIDNLTLDDEESQTLENEILIDCDEDEDTGAGEETDSASEDEETDSASEIELE